MKRKTGQDRSVTSQWHPTTQAIRGGTARSEFGETSEAIFLTSGYAYDCAEDAAARFTGEQQGMTYSRHQNSTVRSEEHTSELQSLMRISYAVFCLTKKINTRRSIQTE